MAPKTLSLGTLLNEAISARLREVHVAFPGIVDSYNVTKQTADITPAVRPAWIDIEGDRQVEALPKLVDVPVLWPRGAGYFLACPLEAGDTVLIVISETALENWRAQDRTVDSSDVRKFDLSDAVAIPGLFPTPRPLESVNSSSMTLGADDGVIISINKSADLIHLGSTSGSEFVALATKTNDRISALETKLNAHINAYNTHMHPTAALGAPSLPTVIDTTLTPGSSVAATKVKAN